MKCVVFITVRTASKRLPKKALMKIKGKPLIKILIDRIKSNGIKKIVVCTTTQKSDDRLVRFLRNYGIEVFRGDNFDILRRLYLAAKKYHVNQFIVVEGDDIFCDPELIQKTCNKMSTSNYDFLAWKDLPFGVSPIGLRTDALAHLVMNKKTKNTETGWGRLIMESGLFKAKLLKPNDKRLRRPDIRLSVDYPEDFQLVKKIYENLPKLSLIKIIELLDKNSDWLLINESVKKKYEANFIKKMSKLELKKVR